VFTKNAQVKTFAIEGIFTDGNYTSSPQKQPVIIYSLAKPVLYQKGSIFQIRRFSRIGVASGLVESAQIPTRYRGCVNNPPTGSEGIVKVLSIIGPDEKAYALANDLELEKSMFIRKRVNFCRPGKATGRSQNLATLSADST